jgi:hypothetical protein
MTDPIELLNERFKEITQAKYSAIDNGLCKEDLKKLNNIHHKYYVCMEILKRGTNKEFIDQGVLYKASIDVFIDQQKEIKKLESTVRRLYGERYKDKNLVENI